MHKAHETSCSTNESVHAQTALNLISWKISKAETSRWFRLSQKWVVHCSLSIIPSPPLFFFFAKDLLQKKDEFPFFFLPQLLILSSQMVFHGYSQHPPLAQITFIFCFLKSINYLYSLIINKKHFNNVLICLYVLIPICSKAFSSKSNLSYNNQKLLTSFCILNFLTSNLC